MSEGERMPPVVRHAAGRPWKKWLAWAAVGIVVLLAGAWIGAAFIPRWWSHRIGDQVDGSIPAGITLGLVYGFLFTILPLLVLAWGFRKRRAWKTWLVFVGVALVLALPNLFTLGIVVGTGNAAHAGERTLDVDAPGFRGGMLAGAILAALALLGVWYLLGSRHRARRDLERLRSQTGRADEPPPAA
jgi:zinc transporter ZupT